MAERQSSKMERKRDRQPISVPFIWEEKPGTPKKDWKPTVQPVKPVVPPVKLVPSIPFEWEEKPGIPIPGFIESPEDSIISSSPSQYSSQGRDNGKNVLPHTNSDTRNFSGPVTPPVKLEISVPFGWEEKPGTPIPGLMQRSTGPTFEHSNEHKIVFSGENERDELSDSEIDVWSCASYDSFSSAPSLLANGLISTNTLSSAIHLDHFDLTNKNTAQMESKNTAQMESQPGSPASETESTSSYSTGSASLAGSSFLEWLFPLLMPNSGREVESVEENNPTQRENVLQEKNGSQVRRPLLTLEELIVMSRRRSCQRKVAKMQKQPSMGFIKRSDFGCFNFRGADIVGLHKKWKRQLQLKLI